MIEARGLTAVRMEWHKLRSVRSTWYIVAIFAADMIGLARTRRVSSSPS